MPYRIDFHSHTGHSSDCLLPAARLLDAAVRRGLAAIAVTDHNTLGGALQAASLVERQPERYAGLAVIAGEEVKTSEGEIIGLFLTQPVPRGLSPVETIARMRDQNALVAIPHPFDRMRGSRLREATVYRVAHLVDAIETFNARTTFPADNARARLFAAAHNLPALAGSDAHVAWETGNAFVAVGQPPARDRDGLLAQVRQGRIGGRVSLPIVHAGSKLAKWRKRLGLAPTVQL